MFYSIHLSTPLTRTLIAIFCANLCTTSVLSFSSWWGCCHRINSSTIELHLVDIIFRAIDPWVQTLHWRSTQNMVSRCGTIYVPVPLESSTASQPASRRNQRQYLIVNPIWQPRFYYYSVDRGTL